MEQGEKKPSSYFLKIYLFIFLFYVYFYMYACTPCMPGSLKNLKRALNSLEAELPCGCWVLSQGPLQEHVLLTAKPNSQPPFQFILTLNVNQQRNSVLTASHVNVDSPESL